MVVRERNDESGMGREAARFVFHAQPTAGLAFELDTAVALQRADRAALGEVSRFWVLFNDKSLLRGSLAVRLLSAVNGLLERMDERALKDAGTGSDDVEALIAALTGPDGVTLGERDLAQLRGALVNRDLLAAEGGTVGANEVARLLSVSRQAVAQRVLRNRLLAVTPTGGRQRFPVWQFAQSGVLPGLEDTLAILSAGEVDPWARLLFFLTEQDNLQGARPLDALLLGDAAGVACAARRYAGVADPAVNR